MEYRIIEYDNLFHIEKKWLGVWLPNTVRTIVSFSEDGKYCKISNQDHSFHNKQLAEDHLKLLTNLISEKYNGCLIEQHISNEIDFDGNKKCFFTTLSYAKSNLKNHWYLYNTDLSVLKLLIRAEEKPTVTKDKPLGTKEKAKNTSNYVDKWRSFAFEMYFWSAGFLFVGVYRFITKGISHTRLNKDNVSFDLILTTLLNPLLLWEFSVYFLLFGSLVLAITKQQLPYFNTISSTFFKENEHRVRLISTLIIISLLAIKGSSMAHPLNVSGLLSGFIGLNIGLYLLITLLNSGKINK